MVHTMRGIFFSTDGPRPWTREEYHQAQRRLDQALAFWLKPGGKWIFLINDEIRPYVVAFMGILAQLAGILPVSGHRPSSVLYARMSLDTGTGNKSYPLT